MCAYPFYRSKRNGVRCEIQQQHIQLIDRERRAAACTLSGCSGECYVLGEEVYCSQCNFDAVAVERRCYPRAGQGRYQGDGRVVCLPDGAARRSALDLLR